MAAVDPARATGRTAPHDPAEPAGAGLPAPRRPGGAPYRVALVCLGNICRSPMADVVLSDRVAAADLRVEVASSGTGDWHVGDPMDRRAAALLTAHGYDASRHEARQFDSSWVDDCDLVLAMDRQNLADVLEAAGPDAERLQAEGRVRLFRDFDPRAVGADREVPDPYFGGDDGFSEVLAMIERTSDRLAGLLADAAGTSR